MSEPAGATIFVVEDNQDIRTHLYYLVKDAGFNVELHSNAQEFLEHYKKDRMGCALLDVRLPGMSGLTLMDEMKLRDIFLPVIFLSAYADVEIVVQAFKKGAFDFLEKPVDSDVLIKRLKQAIELDTKANQRRAYHRELARKLGQLTHREWEIIDKVIKGQQNKVIAAELNVSIPTVETHRKNIMEKLQAQNLSHLVRMIMHKDAQGHWFRQRRLQDNRRASISPTIDEQ